MTDNAVRIDIAKRPPPHNPTDYAINVDALDLSGLDAVEIVREGDYVGLVIRLREEKEIPATSVTLTLAEAQRIGASLFCIAQD